MSYAPLPIKANARISRVASTMPVKGENLRQFSGLTTPTTALKITNYIPDAEGKLIKRNGLQKVFEVAGNAPVTMCERFTSNIIIFGYGTTVAAYNETTQAITTIKANFSANLGFRGARYGNYFFVCNGVEKIWRIFTDLSIAEVANSPICKVVKVFGARLLAGNLSTDATAVKYSEVDSGSNPPFTTWTNSTTATDGGLVNYRNAGGVSDIVTLGKVVVVFADYGKWAFQIDQIDSGGTIKKIDNVVIDRLDLGGDRAIMTKKAIYYVNEGGIAQLTSLGQENIPFSDQDFNVSYILGRSYFEGITFSKAAMAYDEVNEILYVACNKQAAQNNLVIALNTKTGAYSRISGWNINTFFVDTDRTIWGGSSTNTKVYKCFKGSDDDGQAIGTEWYQELNAGDYQSVKELVKFAIQADMSMSTIFNISFDVFKRDGVFKANYASYTMSVSGLEIVNGGYGAVGWGDTSWGGTGEPLEGTFPIYDSCKPMLRNFYRIRVKITSGDKLPHALNMFIADIKDKSPILKRNITTN